jgi:hypothetical protein
MIMVLASKTLHWFCVEEMEGWQFQWDGQGFP